MNTSWLKCAWIHLNAINPLSIESNVSTLNTHLKRQNDSMLLVTSFVIYNFCICFNNKYEQRQSSRHFALVVTVFPDRGPQSKRLKWLIKRVNVCENIRHVVNVLCARICFRRRCGVKITCWKWREFVAWIAYNSNTYTDGPQTQVLYTRSHGYTCVCIYFDVIVFAGDALILIFK